MLDTIFEIVFLICFIAGCAIRATCVVRARRASRNEQNPIADERGVTSLEKLLMLFVLLGMQVIPLIYIFSSWLDFADYRLPTTAGLVVGWTGATIFAVALWLLWRSHADLGRNWSPTLQVREEHSLVTRGVFGHIRHPMYAAHWLWAVAQALLLQNWIAGLAMMAAFLPLYLHRVTREEQMMLEHFGDEYRSYMNRTGRIVPRLRS